MPSHFPQYKEVLAVPNKRNSTSHTLLESMKDFRAAHLAISMPNGARYIPQIPIIITTASRGSLMIRPCMSSILRDPVTFSTAPTHRNISDFETAWKITSITPAHTASGRPTPAQATISPKLEIVEWASTRFPSDVAIAIRDAAKKVNPPIKVTRTPVSVPSSIGEMRIRRYTPAFTMVAECKRADVGVGATIAPRSQPQNGNCALFVIAAKASITSTIMTPGQAFLSMASSSERLVSLSCSAEYRIATIKPHPPRRFIQSALKEF